MRLINTQTLQLQYFQDDRPPYAILSHRWEDEEVLLQDVENKRATKLKGWRKIESCCHLAFSRGFNYVWVDTCCIDKTSSAELSEAINSMYSWYEHSSECYAFLSDICSETLATDRASAGYQASIWFTRGWTLQELIAPKVVLFFDNQWKSLGSKVELSKSLEDVTRIDAAVLSGEMDVDKFSIAQRMSWAARRTTTRPEDLAYCLLGLFGVNMPPLYGEGDKAFKRLQEEIIKQSDDQTLFAWHDDRIEKPMLAPSPSCFEDFHNLRCIYATNDTRSGYTLSNSGLSINLMLIPFDMNVYIAPLSCGWIKHDRRQRSVRNYTRLGIYVRKTSFQHHLVRVSVGGLDYIPLNSDLVAYIRKTLDLHSRQVYVSQRLDLQFDNVYRGFDFSFKHDRMFSTGANPGHDEAFAISPDSLYVRPGWSKVNKYFRLSGLETKPKSLYMYVDFDLDFAPICLITSKTPPMFTAEEGRWVASPDVLEPYTYHFGWVLAEVSGGRDGSAELAFRGDGDASASILSRRLGLQIKFELVYSEERKMRIWNVSFESTVPTSEAPGDTTIPYHAMIHLTEPRHEPVKHYPIDITTIDERSILTLWSPLRALARERWGTPPEVAPENSTSKPNEQSDMFGGVGKSRIEFNRIKQRTRVGLVTRREGDQMAKVQITQENQQTVALMTQHELGEIFELA